MAPGKQGLDESRVSEWGGIGFWREQLGRMPIRQASMPRAP